MSDDDTIHLAFNSLNRPALVGGVPLMFLIFLGFSFGILAFISFIFSKILAFIIILIGILIYLIVRVVCETNPNGLNIIKFKAKGILESLLQQNNVLTFTATSDKKRKIYAIKQFKK